MDATCIRLPTYAAEPAARPRVLVVDPRVDVVDELRPLLESEGYVVEVATSPTQAIAIARDHEIDLAIIDVGTASERVDDDDELDLLRRVLAIDSTLGVLITTTADRRDDAIVAVRVGARDYVELPYRAERVVAMLRTQCEVGRTLRAARRLERENSRLRDRARDEGLAALDGLTLDDAEARLIRRALDRHRGNVSRAAVSLGLSRSALYRRLQRHGLSP